MGGVAATLSSGAVGQDAAGLRCHDAARSAACTVLAVAGVAVAVHLRRLHRAGLGSLLHNRGIRQLDCRRGRSIRKVPYAVGGERKNGSVRSCDLNDNRHRSAAAPVAVVGLMERGIHSAGNLELGRTDLGCMAGNAGPAGVHVGLAGCAIGPRLSTGADAS